MKRIPEQPYRRGDSITLPIPIRDGVMVQIFGLPQDFSPSEAAKISAVLSAYAQFSETERD